MKFWEYEELSLIKSLARTTGKFIGKLASADGRRRSLSFVEDAFFNGMIEGLEENAVPQKLVANMFGVSDRTLRRRLSMAGSSEEASTLWCLIYNVVQTGPGLKREDILCRFSSFDDRTIRSVVSDMIATGWLDDDDGKMSVRPIPNLKRNEIVQWMISRYVLVESTSDEGLADLLKVDIETVREARAEAGNSRIVKEGRGPIELVAASAMNAVVQRFLSKTPGHLGGYWVVEGKGMSENTEKRLRERVEELHRQSFEICEEFIKLEPTDDSRDDTYWMLVSGTGRRPDLS